MDCGQTGGDVSGSNMDGAYVILQVTRKSRDGADDFVFFSGHPLVFLEVGTSCGVNKQQVLNYY